MNESITTQVKESPHLEIYDWSKAKALFNSGKVSARKLSLMKQENIQEAIKEKYKLEDIKINIEKGCGYCFKYKVDYRNLNWNWSDLCQLCPLFIKNGLQCFKLPSHNKMMKARTYKQLSKAHKEWCKELGLEI